VKVFNYLRGTSQVCVTGDIRRVINRVASENILFWGAEANERTVTFYIHTKNVRRVLALYPDAVITGRGVPEKLKKLRNRAAFVFVGLLLSCLWLASGFLVWEFRVTGNSNVEDYEIIRVLNENGVDYGSVGFLIDSEKLSNVVLYEIPELAWFAVNVTGSRAEISVRERVPIPDIVDPNEETSVYAEKSGLVTKVEVYDGTRLVGVGDQVEAGDMLVSGITESCTGVRSEHALARIYAQTSYDYTAEMPKACGVKNYTGEVLKRYGVNICGRVFGWFGTDAGEYERRETVKTLELFGAKLPIGIVTAEFYEYDTEAAALTADECAEILKAELSARLRLSNTGDLLWYDFDVDDSGDVVSVRLRAHCYERIG